MDYRDYIIAFDEHGQPYIAHGWRDRAHKYIERIKTSKGFRYFYDPDEWRAYVLGSKPKVTSVVGRVKDKLGYDERERRAIKKHASNFAAQYAVAKSLKAHKPQKANNITKILGQKSGVAIAALQSAMASAVPLTKEVTSKKKDVAMPSTNEERSVGVKVFKEAFSSYNLLDPDYLEIIDRANSSDVSEKDVEKHERELSESEIIERISGGDETEGSCVSLSLTYIANKLGYDVLDFRGGTSRTLFAKIITLKNMASAFNRLIPGCAHTTYAKNDFDSARYSLEFVEEGKEYLFGAGSHCAMVKKEGGNLYYLELQSPVPTNNGWKELNDEVLEWRFGCAYTSDLSRFGLNTEFSELIDLEAFNNNMFVNLCRFINTDEKDQRKGGGGSVK